ncbi:hypothetical protein ACP275_03G120900 [Erythranthe tilingii]
MTGDLSAKNGFFRRSRPDVVGKVEWLGQVRKNGKPFVARRGFGLGIVADEVDKPGLWEIAGGLIQGPGAGEFGGIWEIRVSIWTKLDHAVNTLKIRYRICKDVWIVLMEIHRCHRRIIEVKITWARDPNNIIARQAIQKLLEDSSAYLVTRGIVDVTPDIIRQTILP